MFLRKVETVAGKVARHIPAQFEFLGEGCAVDCTVHAKVHGLARLRVIDHVILEVDVVAKVVGLQGRTGDMQMAGFRSW